MNWKHGLVAAAVAVISLKAAVAHDYWLQPAKFQLAAGESTPVRLFVGDHFKRGDERPFQPEMTVSLALFGENGRRDLKPDAEKGSKPIVTLRGESAAGGRLIGLERDWSFIELEPKKFNGYLEHEGLQRILKLRKQSGEADSVGRERYRRYLKALVQVGDKRDETFRRQLGHRLEIIPLQDPRHVALGKKLQVRVLFEKKPLADAPVFTYSKQSDKVIEQSRRTDAQGRAEFPVTTKGLWLIRMVHMQRVADDKKADWESFWAAYTFKR